MCGHERAMKRQKLNLRPPIEAPIKLYEKNQTIGREIRDDEISKLAPVLILRNVLQADIANKLLHLLNNESESWNSDFWTVFDKTNKVARTHCMYTLTEEHTVESEQTRKAPELLNKVAEIISSETHKAGFSHFCPSLILGNKYSDGKQNVGRHSDSLTVTGPRPIIAGLSVGARRIFRLYPKDNPKKFHIDLPTPHNSLILMLPGCQEYWYHEVPSCDSPFSIRQYNGSLVRYSLTFRQERPQFQEKLLKDSPTCHCGKPPILKSGPKGEYYLTCNPVSSSAEKSKKCEFYEVSTFAQTEAKKMIASEKERMNEKRLLSTEALV